MSTGERERGGGGGGEGLVYSWVFLRTYYNGRILGPSCNRMRNIATSR